MTDPTQSSTQYSKRVGRFIVLHRIATDGGARRYAAFDPKLERRVTLTGLPRTKAGDLRAVARLVHPNTVAVYDVHTSEGWEWIATEWVDGPDLAQWLNEAARPLTQIVGVFVQVAKGLAAVHEAGLAHRAFHPQSVSMGSDDRPRVAEFVACDEDARRRDDALRFSAALWTVVVNDGRWSQDAFRSTLERTSAPQQLDAPRSTGARGRLLRVLRTQLQPGVNVSMRAIITELERCVRVRHSRRVGFALGATGVATAVAFVGLSWSHSQPDTQCQSRLGHLDDVWNEDAKNGVERIFRSSSSPRSLDAHRRFTQQIDERVKRWTEVRARLCAATYRHREQSEERFALQSACLHERRLQLAGLLGALNGDLDADFIDRAVSAAANLDRPESCAERVAAETSPATVKTRSDHPNTQELRAKLANASQRIELGQYDAATRLLEAVHPQVEATGDATLRAELLLLRGLAIEPTSDLEAAETLLRDAYELALHAGARDVALRAAQSITGAIVRGSGRLEAAKAFVDIALGLSQNLNDEREAASLRQLGSVLQMSARYEESVQALTDAIELYAEHLPANSPRIANARGSLGVSHLWLGDRAAAEVELTRALAALRETFGPSHPQILPGLDALGLLKTKLGHPTQGERLHREAIALRSELFGDRHAGHSESFTNLGVALNRQARYRDAERYFRKALDLDRSLRGPTHPSVGIDLVDIGAARLEQGDRPGAQSYLTQALALLERNGEPNEAMALGAAHLSTVLAWDGRLQEAERKAQRATSICEAITCEPEVLARVRWAAARVGSRRHGFDDTQRRLAKLAHQGFEAEHLSREAAQVTAWLQRKETGSQVRKAGN